MLIFLGFLSLFPAHAGVSPGTPSTCETRRTFSRVCGGNQYALDHHIKNALFLQNSRNVQGVIPCVLCLAVGWFCNEIPLFQGIQKAPACAGCFLLYSSPNLVQQISVFVAFPDNATGRFFFICGVPIIIKVINLGIRAAAGRFFVVASVSCQ